MYVCIWKYILQLLYRNTGPHNFDINLQQVSHRPKSPAADHSRTSSSADKIGHHTRTLAQYVGTLWYITNVQMVLHNMYPEHNEGPKAIYRVLI